LYRPSVIAQLLAYTLRERGCQIQSDGRDWLVSKNFKHAPRYRIQFVAHRLHLAGIMNSKTDGAAILFMFDLPIDSPIYFISPEVACAMARELAHDPNRPVSIPAKAARDYLRAITIQPTALRHEHTELHLGSNQTSHAKRGLPDMKLNDSCRS
jgi:hypothetical protein